jgi:hypothetical protein
VRKGEREGGRWRGRERERDNSITYYLFAVPLPGVEHHYMRLVAVDVLARYKPQEVCIPTCIIIYKSSLPTLGYVLL